MRIPLLRRTDRPSYEEMSVQYKRWLSQGTVISLCKPKGGDGWQWRFGKNEICLSGMLCSMVPCLTRSSRTALRLLLGGSAEAGADLEMLKGGC